MALGAARCPRPLSGRPPGQALDAASPECLGFLDLSTYLDYYQQARPPEQQFKKLGLWIGWAVFGGLLEALKKHKTKPAAQVIVSIPDVANALLSLPFELACFEDGISLPEHGIRFIYQREGVQAPDRDKEQPGDGLRILAAFSLPVSQNPLNLRRERYQLQRLVGGLRSRGLAVELKVLQYGATAGRCSSKRWKTA